MTEIIKLGLSVKTAKIGPTTLGGAGGGHGLPLFLRSQKKTTEKQRKKERVSKQ